VYTLHITNKNYSSWSLRPWVLMRACGIEFDEVLHRFTPGSPSDFRGISPSGRVPWLEDGDTVIWDSLAIAEYLAERHPQVWPADDRARAWARCAAAEMHSGFACLRNGHGMNIGVPRRRHESLARPCWRISPASNACGAKASPASAAPFLAGPEFSAVDAFFAPVVYRFRSYGVVVADTTADYMEAMLGHPALREWELAALDEDFRDPAHEAELAQIGTVTDDLRVSAT
jgi:glutathione S-transferase